ncbi:MAG: hypothetical protein JWQ35_2189 [Bacteriovoracaceae bacterium]|nr:hypothetical protein [Bacteriovoracaceae bacterium]
MSSVMKFGIRPFLYFLFVCFCSSKSEASPLPGSTALDFFTLPVNLEPAEFKIGETSEGQFVIRKVEELSAGLLVPSISITATKTGGSVLFHGIQSEYSLQGHAVGRYPKKFSWFPKPGEKVTFHIGTGGKILSFDFEPKSGAPAELNRYKNCKLMLRILR